MIEILKDHISKIGRAGAHALFPNDFEYYAVTLEVVDSDNQTVEFLTFPVTPAAIEYDDVKIVNVKKTLGGITALDTESFTPKHIAISGTFGRQLRLLIGPGSSNPAGAGIRDTGLDVKTSVLSAKLKTGYGSTKVLERIITLSSQVDKYNKPNRLYLYIPPLGHSFLVKATKFTLNQDYSSSNMMWKYSMQLTALSSIENLGEQSEAGSLINATAFDVLNAAANSVVQKII